MSDAWRNRLRDPNPWLAPRPLPDPIETPRCIVRLYQRGDAARVFDAVSTERDSILPYMAWAETEHLHLDDSVYFVEGCRRSYERADCTDFFMGIFDKQNDALIGGGGFARIQPELREAEVGYWVRGSLHGQGIATETTRALISAGLTPAERGGWGFRRIVIHCANVNVASRRVCEKLGIRLERRERQARYLEAFASDGGAYHDLLGYGVLADEWDFAAHRAKPNLQGSW